jgi:hypothetical protein
MKTPFSSNALTNAFAIVVEDKVKGSHIVKAYPIESLSSYQDELIKVEKMSGTTKNTHAGNTEKQAYLTATKFLNLGGGGGTSPDVKRGELILLWKVRDIEEYSWSTYCDQNDLRGKESKLSVIGNTDEFGVTLDETNSHHFYNNPVKKILGFKTVMNDNEPVAFDISIDYKNGVAYIKDTNGNSLVHDGKNSAFTATFNNSITCNTKSFVINADTIVTNSNKLTNNTGTYTTNASLIRLLGTTLIDGTLTVTKTITDILGLLTNHSHPPR